MHRQPCVVTHTVTVTVCVTMVRYGALVCYGGALRCCITRVRYAGYAYRWCVMVRYKLKLKRKNGCGLWACITVGKLSEDHRYALH